MTTQPTNRDEALRALRDVWLAANTLEHNSLPLVANKLRAAYYVLEAALSAPQPAAQESAQPAGEQERRENSKHWPLLDRVEFALRDASFDLDEAFAIAHHVSLTYPPQPESAQGERGAAGEGMATCPQGMKFCTGPEGNRYCYRCACDERAGPVCSHGYAKSVCLVCCYAALTTPTGDQNARAVAKCGDAFCPCRREPAPVPQVGDGELRDHVLAMTGWFDTLAEKVGWTRSNALAAFLARDAAKNAALRGITARTQENG